jgi:predicted MPP superfamily phosphohydrolase
LTGFLNRLDYLLQFPATVTEHYLHLDRDLNPKGSSWLLRVGINAGLYFAAGFLLHAGRRWAICPATNTLPVPKQRTCIGELGASVEPSPAGATPLVAPTAGSDGQPPLLIRGSSRRRFLITGMKLAGGTAAAGLGYSFLVEPRWFVVSNHVIPIRGLPLSLDGLRLVQLTDIHHGPWLSLAYVREVVQTANDLKPDLIVLTGDYVSQSAAYIQPVVRELGRLQPRIGAVAVLGNHDRWLCGSLTRKEFAQVGIPVIDNARRVLTADGRLLHDEVAAASRAIPVPFGSPDLSILPTHTPAEGLALCGVGDLWTDKQDYRRALGGLPAGMPRLLLSHNPDVAEERALARSGLRVDLLISGHTHGGQVFIPTLGTPIVPSRFGQKYAQGLVEGPVCPVFVCRGIGETVLPLRVGVPPEIAVLQLQAVPDRAARS